MSRRAAKRPRRFFRPMHVWALAAELAALVLFASAAAAAHPSAQFDVAPVAAAEVVAESEIPAPPGKHIVEVHLRVSALLDAPASAAADHLLYTVRITDRHAVVVDYAPRTALASAVEGNVEVTRTDETNKHLGLNLTASYDHLLRGDAGGEYGRKSTDTSKFQRKPQQEVVAASGTLGRGTGVYFKFRRTPEQTLEGDKQLRLRIEVSQAWRAGLLQLELQARAVRSPGLPGSDPKTITCAADRYLVAIHRAGDLHARQAAWRVAAAEQELRSQAEQCREAIRQRSLPTVFHELGAALDLVDPRIPNDWMTGVLFGNADPYFDPQLRKLPVDVRVAILDYQEARTALSALAQPAGDAHLVSRLEE